MWFLLAVLLVTQLIDAYYEPDLIKSLPGWQKGPFPSPQYSGYLSFEDPAGSGAKLHYHYWLSLAESSPESAPLLYWSNGGPGCSSMEGNFYEGGTFALSFDGNSTVLSVRPERWTRFASVLYFETPVGVGFSYRDDGDYTDNNDVNTAQRTLAAMQTFYSLFPEFKSVPLYLSGESYAGVYIPMLAYSILNATFDNTWTGGELVGVIVGNGCTGNTGICSGKCNGKAYAVEAYIQFAIIPPELRKAIQVNCSSQLDACAASDEDWPGPLDSTCQNLIEEVHSLLYWDYGISGAINPYGVQDICLFNSCPTNLPPSDERDRVGGTLLRNMKNARKYRMRMNSVSLEQESRFHFDFSSYQSFSPCLDSSEISAFMNDPEVIQAIHVRPIDFCYAICNTIPGWQYSADDISLPRDVYPHLIPYLKVVIFNGVLDTVVPYTDNYGWVKSMKFNRVEETFWSNWFYTEQKKFTKQTGGYLVEYDVSGIAKTAHASFTFKVVMGSGHLVPFDTPQAAFEMFATFVDATLPVPNLYSSPDITAVHLFVNSSKITVSLLIGIIIGIIVAFVVVIAVTWYWATYCAFTSRLEKLNSVDVDNVYTES
jgi:hypothetical protein